MRVRSKTYLRSLPLASNRIVLVLVLTFEPHSVVQTLVRQVLGVHQSPGALDELRKRQRAGALQACRACDAPFPQSCLMDSLNPYSLP